MFHVLFLPSEYASFKSLYLAFLTTYISYTDIYKVGQKSLSCQWLNSSSTERRSPVREGQVRISPPPPVRIRISPPLLVPLPRKYAQKCKFFFYKLRTMNYSKSRTKIGCQKTQLEIVEDLDNDFPVQYGTELYRKIIIQVPLEV